MKDTFGSRYSQDLKRLYKSYGGWNLTGKHISIKKPVHLLNKNMKKCDAILAKCNSINLHVYQCHFGAEKLLRYGA